MVARGITTGSHTHNSGRINGEEEEVARTSIRIRRSEVVAGIATSDEVDGRVVVAGRPIVKPFSA